MIQDLTGGVGLEIVEEVALGIPDPTVIEKEIKRDIVNATEYGEIEIGKEGIEIAIEIVIEIATGIVIEIEIEIATENAKEIENETENAIGIEIVITVADRGNDLFNQQL